MRQKTIQEEASKLTALVWQNLSKEEQQSAIDLISNIICDYYFSQKKGVSGYESIRRK